MWIVKFYGTTHENRFRELCKAAAPNTTTPARAGGAGAGPEESSPACFTDEIFRFTSA
jgi:hypothetical protein